MARAVHRDNPLRAALAIGLTLGMVLGGCTMNAPGSGSGASRAGAGLDLLGQSRDVVERDVEAPEVFSMEEAGLWDGRPSLGGVWVAHPGTQSPERVLIRNAQNGETVIGALFRRERENPGPRFQISSEAANALGILPGAPTTISVVALRLEQIEPARSGPAAVASDDASGQAGAQAPLETAPPAGTPAGEVEIATVETGTEPRRSFLAGLFGGRSSERSAPPAIAETALAPIDGVSTADVPQETAIAAAPPPPAPERRGLLGIFSRRQAEPAAETTMIPLPEAPIVADVVPASAPAPTTATIAPATTAPVASTLSRPFVQIGIFSVEGNATNARNQMRAAGLEADIRRGRANERDFWRVIVGPAGDATARGQLLERVRAMGFADAYAVVR